MALSGFMQFVEDTKPILVVPLVGIVLTLVWLFFRKTWKELDEEAYQFRSELVRLGKTDMRPMVALVICALILTMQEYYGTHTTFNQSIMPKLEKLSFWLAQEKGLVPMSMHRSEVPALWHDRVDILRLDKFRELWGYAWWAGTRVVGYVFPLAIWKIFFPQDSLLDMGLRTRGFFKHAWIYLLFLGVVLPAMLLVQQSPDFGSYYPFYKTSSRSWLDFLTWECMYFAQFFALEVFFRGFWLNSLRRSFGSGAIFAMCVPYCMIHYGKPYLEACGAIIAGIALGSISMKSKSIYQGFLVHITVAALMDWLSLYHRHQLPHQFWPN